MVLGLTFFSFLNLIFSTPETFYCFFQQVHKMLPTVSQLQDLALDSDLVTCEDGLQVRFRQDIGPLKRDLNQCFDSAVTPLELLQGFFQFYSRVDFTAVCLCPVSGQMRPKNRNWSKSSAMDLVNPLEPQLNVSYNVNATAVKLFTDKCAEAASKMGQMEEQGSIGVTSLFGQRDRTAQGFSMPRIQELGLLHSARPKADVMSRSAPPVEPRPEKILTRPSVAPEASQHKGINLSSLFNEKGHGGGGKKKSRSQSASEAPAAKAGDGQSAAFSAQDAETAKRLETLKQQYLRSPGFKPVFKQKL
jgi:hypothetical protein